MAKQVCVYGSHEALGAAIVETKAGTRSPLQVSARGRVPSFRSIWLPVPDSNKQTLCE